jgi:hypothetical protein
MNVHVTIRKKALGPTYRKVIRPIIRKYKEKTITKTKLKKNQVDNKLKLVGFLQIHNENEKGNLTRVLEHLSRICDDIVVFDDGSTDGSYETALKYTKNIIKAVKNDFVNELEHKQELLDLAVSLNPDWIVWLDADEVFDLDGECYGIRTLCEFGMQNNIDGFSFLEYNLWKDERHYRVDKHWNKLWQVRLWRNRGQLRFEIKKGLHQVLYPLGLTKIYRSDIKVIHYGFSSEEKITQKYNMYKQNGQSGWLLELIKDEEGIKLKQTSKDWFPLSTQKVVVISLIYKSTKYIDFVLNSFRKYTKNAGFIFVANDATEQVKRYLKENEINHLIYENEDRNEYYIKKVYRAYNFGGTSVNADIIVFVNSDMAFSENWLDNLLKNIREDRIVTSRLVESGKMLSGKTAIMKDFGRTYSEFDDENFQQFVKSVKENKLVEGGLFMPCALYKDLFVKSGGYPIGNRVEKSGRTISGDWIFFYEKLKPMGIKHFTVFDSIVYHIQEGEKDE